MESVGDGWEEMTAVDAVPSRPLADGAPSTSLACADVIVRTPYVRFAYKGMHGVVYRSAYYALLRSESCPYYYTPLLRVVRSERGPAVDTEALMAGYVRLTLWVEYDPPDSHPAILDAIRRRLHPRNRRVVTEADLRPMHMRSVVWSFRDEGAELAGAARYPLSMADRPRSPGDRLPMRIMVHGEEAARRARCLMERSPIAMHIAHDVRWVRVHDASERVDAHLAVSDFSLEVTNVHLLASRAWARFWERASRSLAVRTLLASARTMESTAKACGPADRTSFSPGCDRHVMLNTPATAFWGALHEMARAFCIEITDRLGLDLCPAGATFRSVMNRVMHHLRASVEHCVLWDRPSPLADDGRLDTRPCTVQHRTCAATPFLSLSPQNLSPAQLFLYLFILCGAWHGWIDSLAPLLFSSAASDGRALSPSFSSCSQRLSGTRRTLAERGVWSGGVGRASTTRRGGRRHHGARARQGSRV